MGRRRKSQRGGAIDMLFELTGMFWQVGAAATAGFIILAVFAFRWARNIIGGAEASPLLAPMAEAYGWLLYGLPIILLVLAWLIGTRTLVAYYQERFS